MRTRIVAVFVAGGLLVAAGLLAWVASVPGTAQAQETFERRGPVGRALGILAEVLDQLVDDGTITPDQADAILEAAGAEAEELTERHVSLREWISDLFDDGTVTKAETSELPDGHWLFDGMFDEAWEDGEVTIEEIRELRPFRRHPLRRGFRLGALLDDGGIDREEYGDLDQDHPLREVDVSEFLEDGSITPDELGEVLADLAAARFGADT